MSRTVSTSPLKPPSAPWWGRVITGLVWLALGLTAAYWVLKPWGTGLPQRLPAMPTATAEPDVQAVASALGASAELQTQAAASTDMPVDAEWRLVGMAAGPAGQGVALVAQGDGPARPVRVGDVLPGDWQLVAVTADAIRLKSSTARMAYSEIRLQSLGSNN